MISSDGGLLLLREMENRLCLINDIDSVITNNRDPRYVRHTLEDILTHRTLQIAAGCEDAMDRDTLRQDPVFKIGVDRQPGQGAPLAFHPTMSRFENTMSRTDLYRFALVFVTQFICSHDKGPSMIILDIDDTDSETHGA